MRILPTSNHKDFKVSFTSKPRDGNPEMGGGELGAGGWGLKCLRALPLSSDEVKPMVTDMPDGIKTQ